MSNINNQHQSLNTDNDIEFFKLKYNGDRFEDHSIPVDCLPDLIAYQDLLLDFARDAWKEDHPNRQRLPNHFCKNVHFSLVEIGKGSAIPTLKCHFPSGGQTYLHPVHPHLTALKKGEESLVSLFQEASKDNYPAALSQNKITLLNRFGASLKDGESLVLDHSDSSAPTLITAEIRRKLITRLSETYEKRISFSGKILGVHTKNGLDIESDDFGRMVIPVDHDEAKEIYGPNLEALVNLELTVTLDHQDKVKSVEEVHSLYLVDDISQQRHDEIDNLGNLPSNWLGDKSDPPSEQAMKSAHQFVNYFDSLSELFYIYPIAEGGIQIEFDINEWDLSVEFDIKGCSEVYGVNKKEDSKDIDPTPFENIEALCLFLNRYFGAGNETPE